VRAGINDPETLGQRYRANPWETKFGNIFLNLSVSLLYERRILSAHFKASPRPAALLNPLANVNWRGKQFRLLGCGRIAESLFEEIEKGTEEGSQSMSRTFLLFVCGTEPLLQR
jgi:hypothetical protein